MSAPNKPSLVALRHYIPLIAVLLVAGPLLTGCGTIVTKYGYGRMEPSGVNANTQDIDVLLPANAPSISQHYKPGQHDGIDILGRSGTPVIAAAAGHVIRSSFNLMFGHRVVIDHGNDEWGQHILTMYLHLSERSVSKGVQVTRGQQIGELGMTGLLAGFPHLHFVVARLDRNKYRQPVVIDPHPYWVQGPGRITCFDRTIGWPDRPLKTTYPLPCRDISRLQAE